MSEELEFRVTFHSPFRVATGRSGEGLDSTVDLADPLPASSLKGAMRDAASTILAADPILISRVFGSPRDSSPWTWSRAEPLTESGDVADAWQSSSVQTRVVIDEETHTVVEDLIVFAETVEHPAARFTVQQTGCIDAAALDAHRALLRASASAVHHIGANRTRGLGWVTVAEAGGVISAADLELIGAGGNDA